MGESVVEVMPAQVAPARVGEYWMPPYFATWRGSSLVLTDKNLNLLHQRDEILASPNGTPLLLNREKTFVPVDDTLVPLRYGATYDFRIRLADLTFGGPPSTDDTPLLPQAITTIKFQRRTRPTQVNVTRRPSSEAPVVTIEKPRIGYPEAIFTRAVSFESHAELDAKHSRKPGARDERSRSRHAQCRDFSRSASSRRRCQNLSDALHHHARVC